MGTHGDSGLFKVTTSQSWIEFAPPIPSRPCAGHSFRRKPGHRRGEGSPMCFSLIQREGWTPDVHGHLGLGSVSFH